MLQMGPKHAVGFLAGKQREFSKTDLSRNVVKNTVSGLWVGLLVLNRLPRLPQRSDQMSPFVFCSL